MLGNTLNQATKFRSKNWIEINDGSHGVYNTGSQIKFKTSMIRPSLCDYSDIYTLVKGTETVPNTRTAAASRNTNIMFKNCDSDCVKEVNNKEIDHPKDIDVVMPMYNLIEHSDNYFKTSGN